MCSVSVACPLCSQTSFPSIDSLRISLIKAANGPLMCPICREILLGLDKLTIHLFSHTSLIEENDSRDNNYIAVSSKEIKNEINLQEEGCSNDINPHATYPNCVNAPSEPYVSQLKCETCGLTFKSTYLLHMHNTLVHLSSDGIPKISSDAHYQCHLCAKVFRMKGSLRVHMKVVHLVGLPNIHNIPKLGICSKIKHHTLDSAPDTSPKSPLLQLPIAGSQFLCSNQKEVSSKPSTEENHLEYSADKKAESDCTKGTESSKIWECDICSKSFTTKYFLKKHKRLHTGEMPYTCEICGKTFTFQQSYHKHLLYHSDEKPHVCQTCGRAFKELSTLHNHERIHSGEKPFKCETCDKCFRQRVSYLVHKRIHTGAMPYKCTACLKCFRYKVSQRTHKCNIQPSEVNSSSSEDILQKLLHSTSILPEDNNNISEIADELPTSSSKSSPKHDFNEEMLTKSIDEIVAESCNKMGIGHNGTMQSIIPVNDIEERIASPSEGFQNLCLYSPSNAHLETISEESLKQFLYGVEEHL